MKNIPPEKTMDLKQYARELFHRTLKAVDVATAIRANLTRHGDTLSLGNKTFDLHSFDFVLLVALGKASAAMANATLEALDGILVRGLVISGEAVANEDARLSYMTGGHPLPTSRSREVAESVLDLLPPPLRRNAGPVSDKRWSIGNV